MTDGGETRGYNPSLPGTGGQYDAGASRLTANDSFTPVPYDMLAQVDPHLKSIIDDEVQTNWPQGSYKKEDGQTVYYRDRFSEDEFRAYMTDNIQRQYHGFDDAAKEAGFTEAIDNLNGTIQVGERAFSLTDNKVRERLSFMVGTERGSNFVVGPGAIASSGGINSEGAYVAYVRVQMADPEDGSVVPLRGSPGWEQSPEPGIGGGVWIDEPKGFKTGNRLPLLGVKGNGATGGKGEWASSPIRKMYAKITRGSNDDVMGSLKSARNSLDSQGKQAAVNSLGAVRNLSQGNLSAGNR